MCPARAGRRVRGAGRVRGASTRSGGTAKRNPRVAVATTDSSARTHAWRGLFRILGPRMPRVLALELFPDRRVVLRPEAREVGRHLNRAPIRSPQMEDERDAPIGEARR